MLNIQILSDGTARVQADVTLQRDRSASPHCPLVLDGEGLSLVSLSINGKTVSPDHYEITSDKLNIHPAALPQTAEPFTLATEVIPVKPEQNTRLSGLYRSSSMFCTQCEAEGFRRITYFQDRPDVMAVYTVRLEADKKFNVLLANGNFVEGGELPHERHFAVWKDPWPKPSYLFAVVAGDLGSITDTFKTASGRKVHLEVFSERNNVDQLAHSMSSLKRAMLWDEQVFGLEYDLDVYNIVAVGDFNMGAMENKGLNIFNTALTLAKPSTATDGDYERIESVIGHEYFHNWTGNRVTCRDWFQLTLKEGLTVFRDQEFAADIGSSVAVKRIEDIKALKQRQFAEDAGPLAHPIRPDSYIAMDNFYTSTVYEKGAEVIRMYQTLLGGRDGFLKGMKLYFERHDGKAVTCDDFRSAMADANGRDFMQFERWYFQAGTPVLSVTTNWNESKRRYTLCLHQSTPPTPGQPTKLPFHIPVNVALLDRRTGKELTRPCTLELVDEQKDFIFDLSDKTLTAEDIVPSVLRGFSAPVNLRMAQSNKDLAFVAANDTDDVNRWTCFQALATRVLIDCIEGNHEGLEMLDQAFSATLEAAGKLNLSFAAYMLTLPSEDEIAQALAALPEPRLVDPTNVYNARLAILKHIATKHSKALTRIYDSLRDDNDDTRSVSPSSTSIARRRLRNVCLQYLCLPRSPEHAKFAMMHFKNATCMTDRLAALQALSHMKAAERTEALETFYLDAAGDALVVNKWFTVQATSDFDDVLTTVMALKQHKDFTMNNPNRMRALIGGFVMGARRQFHAVDGSGYNFLGQCVAELDKLNPQTAARMCGLFAQWAMYTQDRQVLMKQQLQRISTLPGVSKDVYEVASKSLGA